MCIGVTFAAHLLLFYTPGVAYFIMRRIIGVTDELAEISLIPLKILILPCVFSKYIYHTCSVNISTVYSLCTFAVYFIIFLSADQF